jgi:3-hydroxyisobutyrate dehydrogenase
MRIGFIGLGTMGGVAALNLIKGGHQLAVCDLDSERAKEHLALGATWADTPANAAKDADIVFTMVFGPKQIEQVVRGPCGLLSAMGSGQIWVDMTTNQPTLARALGSELAAKGVQPVDAPVTGAVDGARNGNMTQFAGGDEDTIERIRPVMELMGPMHYMGQSGSGSITKLASNQLWAINATAMLCLALGTGPKRTVLAHAFDLIPIFGRLQSKQLEMKLISTNQHIQLLVHHG